jgi:hypothetical protein
VARLRGRSRRPDTREPATGVDPETGGSPRDRELAWYWRLLAWMLALPIGFASAALPAYWLRLIRGNDILDLLVGSGLGRYTRLGELLACWAFANVVVVHLLIAAASRHAGRRVRR